MFIEISGVRIQYASNESLGNINLQIPEGITVITGRNGAGKSSLISVLEGLVRIDRRENVKISGIPVYKKSHLVFKDVASIPEKPFPLLGPTVKDWIRMYSLIREISFERLKFLLNYFDLNYLLRQNSKFLSMGETQLVAVILCLASKARYFILDEPNANLDRENRIKLANVIEKMKHEMGASFLITSHILDEILSIADSIIMFSRDKISNPMPNEISKKFLIVKSIDPERLEEKIKGKIKYVIQGRDIMIRDGKLGALMALLDGDIMEQIISINAYPEFIEGEFKNDSEEEHRYD